FDGPEQRVATGAGFTFRGIGLDERSDLAHEVAAARLFDLDDLGTLLSEETGTERRGDAGPEVEHAQARERTGQRFPCSRFTASIPPALRASTLASAVGVLETNWWSMK